MTIDAPCPNCGTIYTVRRELIGKRTKCTRCGTPFVITEVTPAQAQPATPPPSPEQGLFSDIPIHQSYAPHAAPPTSKQSSPGRNRTGEFFGFERDQSRPRFPALRIVARAYEVMAVIVLVFAAGALVLFLVSVIREPSSFLAALVSSGFAFFWLLAMSLMFLFISQAIRLGLQIEQNTRETGDACRQLTDHLTAIQVDK
jgi:predicted Zn finger-like uncharacterized protein